MTIKIRKIDNMIEERIITAMIVSNVFLQDINPNIDLSYFKGGYTQKVASWILDFYDDYKKAPFEHIQDIFNSKRQELKDDDEIVQSLLTKISERYELEQGINIPYMIDQATRYFKKREIEITVGNAQILIDEGKVDRAEHELLNFRKIAKLTSEWINPFDQDQINKVFHNRRTEFFKFPGVLGEFLQPFERDWLVGISAPFKKGKTWFAQEFAIIGLLSRLKVAFFSLEMSKSKTLERIYKRLTGAYDKGTTILYPTFDCRQNQEDNCTMPQRENQKKLVNDDGEFPDFKDVEDYTVCNFCRNHPEFKDNYIMSTWFFSLDKEVFEHDVISEKLDPIRDLYDKLLWVKCYPRFSANVGDIMRDLDILEQTEGFTPDIIIVDYADILKPEDETIAGIEKEDRTWIALSQLSGTRHCLVVAPTQITKEGLDAVQLTQKHTARWIGKLGHVDAMFALNQTELEKDRGILRVSTMAHRHEDFNQNKSVTVLQELKTGQVNLDSEYRRAREENG